MDRLGETSFFDTIPNIKGGGTPTTIAPQVLTAALFALLCVMEGCSGQKSQVPFNQGEYQQILDRQKAGLAFADEPTTDSSKEMTPHEYDRLGDLYLRQNNPAMAIVQYQKAVEADTSLFHVHNKIGEMFLKRGLPQDAVPHFQEALKHDEKNALALAGIGEAYFRMGQEKEAEESFHKAIALNPSRWQTHNFLGMLFDRQKRHEEAIAEYEQGLKVSPNEATLLNNLGLAYYLVGRYEDAVNSFQRALLTGSAQPKIHNNLGLALAKLNRYHDALESFRLGSSEEEAYNNLGVFYLSAGKAGNAVACFKKAIEISPRYYDKANDNLKTAKHELEKNQEANRDTIKINESRCPAS